MSKVEFNKMRRKMGDKMRSLRKRRGWSQEDLSFECGLHRTYIGGVERGERNVSINNIAKIANSLDVSVGELTKGL